MPQVTTNNARAGETCPRDWKKASRKCKGGELRKRRLLKADQGGQIDGIDDRTLAG